MRFAHFVRNTDISKITEHDIELFLHRNAGSNNARQRYGSFLTKFFIYWQARQQIKRVPTVSPRPITKSIFFPYIYTRAEIRAILDAIGPYVRCPNCCLDAKTIKVILLMVYGTGMRIGDVLGLLGSDIDLKNRIIRIRHSYDGTRVVPISADVELMLRRYLTKTRRAQLGSGRPLFLTAKGTSVRYNVLSHCFRQLRRYAGISRANSPYQPRIHDLRHSFAVHSITSWTPDGIPAEKMLSLLAADMGRMDMTGIERYVELSPSSYQSQLAQLRKKS